MDVRTIAATTHGRYLVDAPDGVGPWPVLIGFHGYAESAATHLEVLARLDPGHRWLRVSVQALHRFYARMQDVVASWMTRQDRALAIADNIAYALAVRDAVAAAHATRGPLVVVGLSQGAAQAYRSGLALGPACAGILVLGGDLPPDVAPHASSLPPVMVGRGRADSWYPPDRFAADVARLRAAGVQVEACEFDGGHEWADALIDAARAWLDARTAVR